MNAFRRPVPRLALLVLVGLLVVILGSCAEAASAAPTAEPVPVVTLPARGYAWLVAEHGRSLDAREILGSRGDHLGWRLSLVGEATAFTPPSGSAAVHIVTARGLIVRCAKGNQAVIVAPPDGDPAPPRVARGTCQRTTKSAGRGAPLAPPPTPLLMRDAPVHLYCERVGEIIVTHEVRGGGRRIGCRSCGTSECADAPIRPAPRRGAIAISSAERVRPICAPPRALGWRFHDAWHVAIVCDDGPGGRSHDARGATTKREAAPLGVGIAASIPPGGAAWRCSSPQLALVVTRIDERVLYAECVARRIQPVPAIDIPRGAAIVPAGGVLLWCRDRNSRASWWWPAGEFPMVAVGCGRGPR